MWLPGRQRSNAGSWVELQLMALPPTPAAVSPALPPILSTPSPGQIYNLGTGTGYSVLQMVQAMEKASGKKVGSQPPASLISQCTGTGEA